MDPGDFIGNLVQLKAASGSFQGVITCIDTNNQTITLKDPLQYGRPMPISQVTILATDIEDLRFVQKETVPEEVVVTKKPPPPHKLTNNGDQHNTHSGKKDGRPKPTAAAGGHSYRQQRGSHRSSARKTPSTADWLGADIENHDYAEDFDFQSNNLKFDKSAFYEDYGDSDIRLTYGEEKFAHDEMILETQPVTYRQIQLLANGSGDSCEYYTDNGLVIPCISSAIRENLCQVAHSMGFTYSRQIEAFGINTSQMLLTLLGGPNRLRPLNSHQLPHVVIVVCGDTNMCAIRGLALGRHLSNHNIQITILLTSPQASKFEKQYREEVKLTSFTSCKLITDPKYLPDSPVDLVVTAVGGEMMDPNAVRWCSSTNAPILSLSTQSGDVRTKWSVCTVLPSSTCNGAAVYLVDIGFTSHMFQQVGIKYKSPFCGKTFIPLHSSQ